MTSAELIDAIVAKCKSDISVFLGAGASMPIGLPDMVSFWENAYGNDFFDRVNSGCPYVLNSKNNLNGGQIAENKNSILRRLIQTAGISKGQISCDLEELLDYIHNCPILSSSITNLEGRCFLKNSEIG